MTGLWVSLAVGLECLRGRIDGSVDDGSYLAKVANLAKAGFIQFVAPQTVIGGHEGCHVPCPINHMFYFQIVPIKIIFLSTNGRRITSLVFGGIVGLVVCCYVTHQVKPSDNGFAQTSEICTNLRNFHKFLDEGLLSNILFAGRSAVLMTAVTVFTLPSLV